MKSSYLLKYLHELNKKIYQDLNAFATKRYREVLEQIRYVVIKWRCSYCLLEPLQETSSETLTFPKESSELLGSRAKVQELLSAGIKVIFYHIREKNSFFLLKMTLFILMMSEFF